MRDRLATPGEEYACQPEACVYDAQYPACWRVEEERLCGGAEAVQGFSAGANVSGGKEDEEAYF